MAVRTKYEPAVTLRIEADNPRWQLPEPPSNSNSNEPGETDGRG